MVSEDSTTNRLLAQARDSFQKALGIDMNNLKARSGLKRAESLAAKVRRKARKFKGIHLFQKRCERHGTMAFSQHSVCLQLNALCYGARW
eukprot:COSAG02_NODE_3963_length_5980_cov_16.337528_9_plen_90_part_00